MRSPVSGPTSYAAVRRIRASDRFYLSRDRYTKDLFLVSVRTAHRLQPENPDASRVMFCNGPCSQRTPTSGVPPMHVCHNFVISKVQKAAIAKNLHEQLTLIIVATTGVR